VKLLPYEVLPLSHDAGIMECVRDAITIDELKRKGKTLQAVLDNKAKRRNFIHTLTAYSLVTYFLQVKDRHNGNIMIRKDGSIFHIDYGFFMSNLPGKGV
jgi:phosphatidylinositol 4-kinase B